MIRYLLLFMPFCLHSQSISDYLSAPFPTELTSGKQSSNVAWVFNEAGSRNIYYAEGPTLKASKLTSFKGDDGLEISNLVFSPDGQNLIFVRGNSLNKMGNSANPAQLQEPTDKHIYVINLRDKSEIKLAKGSDPIWSPNGRIFLLSKIIRCILQPGKVVSM